MNKPKTHIRKGDVVVALSGEDAGKTGKVLQVYPAGGKALVEGLNFMKRHTRKSQDNPQGAIVEREAPMALSKLKRREEGAPRDRSRKTS